MNLTTINPAALPLQVYAHNPEHDVTLTADPARFRPVRSTGYGWVKPAAGSGLWTAPVTGWGVDGGPADSAWLEWMRSETDTDTSDLLLTEIVPTMSARLLLIDSHEDLAALVDAYPQSSSQWGGQGRLYPDWVALATAGWDGVYLTDRGQWATRLPVSGPDLYSWDLESMLWLRHAYRVGRTVPSVARHQAGAA